MAQHHHSPRSAGPTLRIYRLIEDLEDLRPAWDALVTESSTASVFSTWEWLSSWWRAYGASFTPYVIGFFDVSEHLIGLAPLEMGHRRFAGRTLRVIRLLGDGSYDSDHLDFPVRPGFENEVAQALCQHLVAIRADWDLCELDTLPADSAVGTIIARRLKQFGWTHGTRIVPGSAIPLPDSWDAYLSAISKKERDKLRYYMKRITKKYKADFSKCSEVKELPAWLEDLYTLHHKRWSRRGESGSLTAEARRLLYHGAAEALLARGWLEFWRLQIDGQTVATQFGFRHRTTVYALQEGFDPDYYADGVGYVLRGHVLKEVISQGVRRYDFLAGETSSKERWGTASHSYINLHFARPFSWGALYLLAVHRRRAYKEWLRARTPGVLWRSVRRAYRAVRTSPTDPSLAV